MTIKAHSAKNGQLKRKGLKKPPMTKTCEECGGTMTQRPTESCAIFEGRKTCSAKCHNAAQVRRKTPAEVGAALQSILTSFGGGGK